MLQGKRIFYIEDDLKNRMIVQTIVQAAGALIEFEKWGFQEIAIPKLRAFHADLVLLDLMFPMNISGYDIFDRIRRDPVIGRLPVVIVSAADPSVEIPRARARGLNGYISKPIDLRLFPEQLEQVLSGMPVWDTR